MAGNANGRELEHFRALEPEIEALAKLRIFPAVAC